MDRMDPHELFPMVFHQISVENYACAELPLPEDLFHKPGVGLHVIYHRSKEERLCYTAWCYTKDLPLLRFIRNVSLPVNTNSLQEANQHVVDHICNDERLPSDFERFLDWTEDVDYLKAPEGTPLGSAVAERFDCFEFCLPECVFGRSDIKLQITYRSTNAKKTQFDVWCHADHFPFLGHIWSDEIRKSGNDTCQEILNLLSENDQVFEKTEDFLNLIESFCI